MGYYTTFNLEIISGENPDIDYEQEIADLTDYNYVFDSNIKWYEHETDMLAYSKNHPNTVFCVIGEGEEAGDLWKKYFKDGKKQNCQARIVYDDFDESKLI